MPENYVNGGERDKSNVIINITVLHCTIIEAFFFEIKKSQREKKQKKHAHSFLSSENPIINPLYVLTSERSQILHLRQTMHDCNIITFTKLQQKFSVLFNTCSISNSKALSPKPITPPEYQLLKELDFDTFQRKYEWCFAA